MRKIKIIILLLLTYSISFCQSEGNNIEDSLAKKIIILNGFQVKPGTIYASRSLFSNGLHFNLIKSTQYEIYDFSFAFDINGTISESVSSLSPNAQKKLNGCISDSILGVYFFNFTFYNKISKEKIITDKYNFNLIFF